MIVVEEYTPYNSWLTCAAVRTGHKYTHCKGTENTTLKTRRRLCLSNTWNLSLIPHSLGNAKPAGFNRISGCGANIGWTIFSTKNEANLCEWRIEWRTILCCCCDDLINENITLTSEVLKGRISWFNNNFFRRWKKRYWEISLLHPHWKCKTRETEIHSRIQPNFR